MSKRLSVFVICVVLITATAMMAVPAIAQTGQSVLTPVRCGTKLVQIGDTKEQVLAKCGAPYYRYPGTEGGGEMWVYNRGSGRFSGFMRFTGNRLTAIEKTGYGFTEPKSPQD